MEKREKKSLRNARDIEKWTIENRRMPRQGIKGVKKAKGDKETPEQVEIRLGRSLVCINRDIITKYEGFTLEEIENEQDREIVAIMRELNSKYDKLLLNAQEIEKWAIENGRIPRQNIKGVKTTKKREEETPEQTELRLGHALIGINFNVIKLYEGKELDEIDDDIHREIVRIIRRMNSRFDKNKQGRKKKNVIADKENIEQQLVKALLNLIKTRSATVEQIRIMAEYYGVNLDELKYSIEEQQIEDSDEIEI